MDISKASNAVVAVNKKKKNAAPNEDPPAMHTVSRVPLLLLPKFQAELQRMEEQSVIVKVTQPEAEQQHEKRNILYQLPTTEETLAKLAGSTVFTSLDAVSGF